MDIVARFERGESVETPQRTVYTWRKALKEGDIAKVADIRGNGGERHVHPDIEAAFLDIYLRQNRLTTAKAMNLTKIWVENHRPELTGETPSYRTFCRIVGDIPPVVLTYRRMGLKALKDRHAPYITRDYSTIKANDLWVGDTHTLDLFSVPEPGGSPHRLKLNAWADAHSQCFTGASVSEYGGSNEVLLSMRDGIRRFGAPDGVLVDNGSEYCTRDVGGRGHRKRVANAEELIPPNIFQGLEITPKFALVRNAQAKIIERFFREVCENFSKLWDTYCGSNATQVSELCKKTLNEGKHVPTDAEVRDKLREYLFREWNNAPYTGSVKAYKGMTRSEVFRASVDEQRLISEDDLNVPVLRHTTYQTVGRNGVKVEVAGKKFTFISESMKRKRKAEKTLKEYGDGYGVRYFRPPPGAIPKAFTGADDEDGDELDMSKINKNIEKYRRSA